MDNLLKGNKEFKDNSNLVFNTSNELINDLSKNGQHPNYCVITCADSRVSPEIIFHKTLGDLFVIRVAGNVLDDAVMGSVEYALEHLHVEKIIVLGHTHCGAVHATIQGGATGYSKYLTDSISEVRQQYIKNCKTL